MPVIALASLQSLLAVFAIVPTVIVLAVCIGGLRSHHTPTSHP